MKRRTSLFFGISVLATFVLLLIQYGWRVYQESNGANVEAYHRFTMTDEAGNESFNWWGIISPIQSEAQTIHVDSIHKMVNRVYYKHGGKGFDVVEPVNAGSEEEVGQQLGQKLSESLKPTLKTMFGMDFDGTSESVRKAVEPGNRAVAEPKIYIGLLATASPEARKYGPESVLPGNYEEENLYLATDRLKRLDSVFQTFGFIADSLFADELQFEDTASSRLSLTAPSILDSMRYGESTSYGTKEWLEVETFTLPILLPLDIAVASYAIYFLILLILFIARTIKEALKPRPLPPPPSPVSNGPVPLPVPPIPPTRSGASLFARLMLCWKALPTRCWKVTVLVLFIWAIGATITAAMAIF